MDKDWIATERVFVTSRALAEYLLKPNADRTSARYWTVEAVGTLFDLLASLGCRVTLLDLSAASLKFAQRKAEDLAGDRRLCTHRLPI